jgi:hypothetical protein
MTESKCARNVRYVCWEFCKDKRGRLGFHQKFVSSRSDSEAFLGLVCLRCKYLRVCGNCGLVKCAFGYALRHKPCGNFRLDETYTEERARSYFGCGLK